MVRKIARRSFATKSSADYAETPGDNCAVDRRKTAAFTEAAIYLRVSTDTQTTENQRRVLAEVAERRGWTITATYENAAISGAQGRESDLASTPCSRMPLADALTC